MLEAIIKHQGRQPTRRTFSQYIIAGIENLEHPPTVSTNFGRQKPEISLKLMAYLLLDFKEVFKLTDKEMAEVILYLGGEVSHIEDHLLTDKIKNLFKNDEK
ncbi:MAG: hypothetical protein E6R04_11965 [Spirochaetes bacterium]|nr:MAG: hypothetical protein E6R04_11965 [Spirochaetota bacterium]